MEEAKFRTGAISMEGGEIFMIFLNVIPEI
jgi:hypothetical protein